MDYYSLNSIAAGGVEPEGVLEPVLWLILLFGYYIFYDQNNSVI